MEPPREFAPGIFLVDVATPEYGVRGALVLGETHALVWDTLTHPRDMTPFLPLIGHRRLVIVYSHADWDHVWGTAGLPYQGADVVGQAECARRFADDVPVTLDGKRRSEPGRWEEIRLVAPTRTFDVRLDLDLGGVTIELHHLPGHTRDCSVGFVVDAGVLLAGDTVETPCPVVPADSPLGQWTARLRRWRDDPRVRSVVPAHGPVGGREILSRNLDYLQALLDGRPLEPIGPLTAFYRDTHEANTRWRPSA
jgi:glyoxylase-like metal-dependent hydrolase (beta-lactamase superfamily II)